MRMSKTAEMALTKEVKQKVTVIENGSLEVLTITDIMEDGVRIASTNHREVVVPGQNVSTKSDRVKSLAGFVHTAAVIAAYRA